MNAPANRPRLGDIRTLPIGEIAGLPADLLAILQDEAALGEVVRAGPYQGERRPLGHVGEAAEGGAVEREVAAPVGETRAGLGLRHPGAELDLADAGTGNPDDRRFRHGGVLSIAASEPLRSLRASASGGLERNS